MRPTCCTYSTTPAPAKTPLIPDRDWSAARFPGSVVGRDAGYIGSRDRDGARRGAAVGSETISSAPTRADCALQPTLRTGLSRTTGW